MGNWGNFLLVFVVGAALGGASSSWGWVTDRQVNDDYSKILHIDRRATVQISRPQGKAVYDCTATFLTDTTAISAGHCPDEKLPNGGLTVDGIEALQAFRDDEFDYDKQNGEHDISILVFPPGTGRALGIESYPKLAKDALAGTTTAYTIGFGVENFYALVAKGFEDGAGVKGWGTMTVNPTDHGVVKSDPQSFTGRLEFDENGELIKSGDPVESRILSGDSGGALYNEDGEIIGIASVMSIPPTVEPAEDPWLALRGVGTITEWKVSSFFTEISEGNVSALLEKAVHCQDGEVCADPALLGKPAELAVYHPERFRFQTLRTAVYASKTSDVEFALRPNYIHEQLVGVDVREKVGNKVGPRQYFACDETGCESGRAGEWPKLQIVPTKKGFVFNKLERRWGGFLAPKITKLAAYTMK